MLRSATSGDKIVLADGTYTPEWGDGLNALVVDKSIEISALHPGKATLDGRGALRIIKVEANALLALDGVVMTRGRAAVEEMPGLGAGVVRCRPHATLHQPLPSPRFLAHTLRIPVLGLGGGGQ